DLYTETELFTRYGIRKLEYDYTVSSLLPHKNLDTVLRTIKNIKGKNLSTRKFVISGVGGRSEKSLRKMIKENKLEKEVIITGYISEKWRNTLYKYCRLFLFPSVFEGFGMPPIEAMQFGIPVITTKLTSIPEVTQRKAYYVDNPYDEQEWEQYILNPPSECHKIDMKRYETKNIIEKYVECFRIAERHIY
ncbi:MAG: glycosyltransferase, partial [Ruminococcus flavefaciens]|nr:glycosyltransferase [Ruminococcus flavefaciens]